MTSIAWYCGSPMRGAFAGAIDKRHIRPLSLRGKQRHDADCRSSDGVLMQLIHNLRRIDSRVLRNFVWALLTCVLLVPALAMPFTSEVDWNLVDFVFAAILLGTIGVACEYAPRLSAPPAVRGLIVIGIVAVVCAIWADAAVGIFD
ncbi:MULTISPECIES: hypothetical protein [Sphingomonas]|nr:hypothetical protein [Sphingomonas sp. Sph1(2015)]